MIKFSSISGTTVTSEPKHVELSKEQLDLDGLKATILGLLEQTLTIRNYGTGYKHDAMMTTEIDGKEMFVEALLDFLSEKENKKAITYLESLKETNRDWQSIDVKIGEIIYENNQIKFLSENSSYLDKVRDFLDKYALSEDFDDILEQQILKVEDYEGALKRSEVATAMLENEKYNTKYPKNRIRSIANKFMYRAKVLSEKKEL